MGVPDYLDLVDQLELAGKMLESPLSRYAGKESARSLAAQRFGKCVENCYKVTCQLKWWVKPVWHARWSSYRKASEDVVVQRRWRCRAGGGGGDTGSVVCDR